MKLFYFLLSSLATLTSCSATNPDACFCAKELSKPFHKQDAQLMKACAEKGEALKGKNKLRWFEKIMACVDETAQ